MTGDHSTLMDIDPKGSPDGFKTEYVRYYTREDRRGTEYSRWWYERGRPIKMTKRGQIVFDTAKR